MKPPCQFHLCRPFAEFERTRSRFPRIDRFFQSWTGEWRGFSSPHNRQDRFRNFRSLTREYYGMAAREHLKEMIAFGFVVATSAWAIIYTVVVIVRLLLKEQP